MENRLPIGTDDDEIRVRLLAIGQFAEDEGDDQVGNEDGPAFHFEFDRAARLVGQALVLQFAHAPLVNGAALRLKIGAEISLARPRRVRRRRAFVPIQSQPAQPAEDDFRGLLRIAGGVGVLDAQDKHAAGVAGIEPVKQGGARPADVQKARRTGRKANASIHGRFIDS